MYEIREIAEERFAAAFECAHHRPARRAGLEGAPERAVDTLRTTLCGISAFHLSLLSSPTIAEPLVMNAAANFATVVDDDIEIPGFTASRAFGLYVSMFRSMCPLEIVLGALAEDFLHSAAPAALRRTSFLGRRKVATLLDLAVADSVRYALNFYERQSLGLEERPEIALLDE